MHRPVTSGPATAEHRADHARVLGDLTRFGERVRHGSISRARAYVTDNLPRNNGERLTSENA